MTAKRTLDPTSSAFQPSSKRMTPSNVASPAASTSSQPQPRLASIFTGGVGGQGGGDTFKFLTKIEEGKSYVHFVNLDQELNKGSSKVACFDLDGCVIKTRSGAKFPKDASDWSWWDASVPKRLRSLHADGYAIVFISNQAGNSAQQTKFQQKLPLLARNLKLPFRAFAALEYNQYRKPAPGLWDLFEADFNNGTEIDYEASFYIGDAAGRPQDHNTTDRQLAENCGLPFQTPEEFFLSKPVDANWSYGKTWDAKLYDHSLPFYIPTSRPLAYSNMPGSSHPSVLEVVVFVGLPASGKTSLYRKYFETAGYVHVNQDTLKTRAACLSLVQTSLTSNPPRSVVVDNTSPSPSVRSEYLSLIHSLTPPGRKIQVRAFYFSASLEVVKHNSVYRALKESRLGKVGRKVLPVQAFRGFQSGFVMPTIEEGFDEVKTINFKFEGTEEEKRKWSRWLGGVYPKN